VRPSAVWRIPRVAFEGVVSRRPSLAIRVTRQIGSRFKHVESRVENLVFRDVRTRLVNILLELADDFGRRDEQGAVAIEMPLTQAELAKLIGSTRQSVNQSMRELEAAGLVERRSKRILLRKPDELARIGRSTQTG
jgi:CRP/FNR family transcriptional regulator